MSDDNRERAKREGWATPSNALPPHVLAMPPARAFDFFGVAAAPGDSMELTVTPTNLRTGPFRFTVTWTEDHACGCDLGHSVDHPLPSRWQRLKDVFR